MPPTLTGADMSTDATTTHGPVLRIEDLEIEFRLREGNVHAVNGINLAVPRGKVVALVGESGCGKSVTAKAMLGLLPGLARVTRGRVLFDGEGMATPVDIASLPPNGSAIRALRGRRISMIFQEPMASFSPVHTIGNQIGEVIRLHEKMAGRELRERIIETLRLAAIPTPERRLHSFPHELSGGLRQRAMIAMALAARPEVIVADEPTTALDVTIQAQILQLMRDLQQRLGMTVLIITHDLGVVAQIADEVAVMYMGRIVEHSTVEEIFSEPRHPYTRGLLDAVPVIGTSVDVRLQSVPGSVPGPFSKIEGCPFHPRCSAKIPGVCDVGAPPPIVSVGADTTTACHLYTGAVSVAAYGGAQ